MQGISRSLLVFGVLACLGLPALADNQTTAVSPGAVASVYEREPGRTIRTDHMVGKFATNGRARTYAKFDSSKLRVPTGAVLKRATLVFDVEIFVGSSTNLYVHRVIDSWSASRVNWNNKPDHWMKSPGKVSVSRRGKREIIVTAIVRKWVDGSAPNQGFALLLHDDAARLTIARPTLKLTYDTPEPDIAFATTYVRQSLDAGVRTSVWWKLDNKEEAPSPGSTKVEVYLSRDDRISPGQDVFLGSGYFAVPGAHARSGWQRIDVTIPTNLDPEKRTYYIGFVADRPGQIEEADESNNVHVEPVVIDSRPDVYVMNVTTPKSDVAIGERMVVDVDFHNAGKAAAPDFTYRVLLRPSNARSAAADIVLQDRTLFGLARQQRTHVTFDAEIPDRVTAGQYQLWVIADPQNALDEVIETNNARYGGMVTVKQAGPAFLILGEWREGAVSRDYGYAGYSFKPQAGQLYVFEAEPLSLERSFLYVRAGGRFRWSADGKSVEWKAQSTDPVLIYAVGWGNAPGTLRARVRLALPSYGKDPIESLYARQRAGYVIQVPGELNAAQVDNDLLETRPLNRGLDDPYKRRWEFRDAFMEAILRPTAIEADSTGDLREEVKRYLLEQLRDVDGESAQALAHWAEHLLDDTLDAIDIDTEVIVELASATTKSKKAKAFLGRMAAVADALDDVKADAEQAVWKEVLLHMGATAMAAERLAVLQRHILSISDVGSPVYLGFRDAEWLARVVIERRDTYIIDSIRRAFSRAFHLGQVLTVADSTIKHFGYRLVVWLLTEIRVVAREKDDLRRLCVLGTLERLLKDAKATASPDDDCHLEEMRLALGVAYYTAYEPLIRPTTDNLYQTMRTLIALASKSHETLREEADHFHERAELLVEHLRRGKQ